MVCLASFCVHEAFAKRQRFAKLHVHHYDKVAFAEFFFDAHDAWSHNSCALADIWYSAHVNHYFWRPSGEFGEEQVGRILSSDLKKQWFSADEVNLAYFGFNNFNDCFSAEKRV